MCKVYVSMLCDVERNEGELVVYQTDKSSRLAVDTADNYIRSMQSHIEEDEEVTEEEKKATESLINAHSVSWMRFLQVGDNTGDGWRIKMSMQTHNNDASVLYSLRKDHKEQAATEEEEADGTEEVEDERGGRIDFAAERVQPNAMGPPVRPVCDISDGVGHKLSYLMSNILQELCYGETACNSTEEMLAAVGEANNRGISDSMVMGSLDVIAYTRAWI